MTETTRAIAAAAVALAWLVVGDAPAAVGIALLVATVPLPDGIEGIVLGGGALVVLPVLAEVGTSADWFATSRETLPAAMTLVTAIVLLAAAGFLATVRPWCRVLVVPAVAFGVPAADALSPSMIAVLAGAAAVAAVWFTEDAVLPLAASALAATAVPGGRPAASLLAAAAVLAVPFVDRGRLPALLGLPGVAALAAAIAAGPVGFPRATVTVAVAATVALLLLRTRIPEGAALGWSLAPAATVGLWLLVAPGTWEWVGDARLGHWDVGAVLAVVGAGIAVAAVRGNEARR